MQKTLNDFALLDLVDGDIIDFLNDNSARIRVLSEGQASVDFGGKFYKNWEVIDNPLVLAVAMQGLRPPKNMFITHAEVPQAALEKTLGVVSDSTNSLNNPNANA